eukprot:NODE_9398_length_1427_cov_4.226154.p1 GENE.NODE_9398_length_1427_cov_4.226154~~NODE_9398_length_1427_cov_4.226154.p1  ORF type:complete len:408 (+),score=148.20 NODE_9398_length_1427_cov_4.226154:183-1226(+)
MLFEETSRKKLVVSAGSTLLTDTLAREFASNLPTALRWLPAWRLAYSPRVHGTSLQAFFRRMAHEGPSLLLVQDSAGIVFGGFASMPWHIADRYYGTGESFVFRVSRPMPKPAVPLSAQRLLADADGAAGREEATREAMRKMADDVERWREKVKVQRERDELVLKSLDRVTSMTEALDNLEASADDAAFADVGATGAGRPGADAFDGAGRGDTGSTACAADDVVAEAALKGTDGRAGGGGGGRCAGSGGAMEDREPIAEEEEEDEVPRLNIFSWAAPQDPFFQFSDLEGLAMGGGSAFALYLDEDLLHGVSEPCSTYASETLSSSRNFIICNLEVWVFDESVEGMPV